MRLNRRGLFGLFAKGAVAAPFVSKAVIDAAQAEMTPAGISKAHLAEEDAAVYGTTIDPSGRFTLSTRIDLSGRFSD